MISSEVSLTLAATPTNGCLMFTSALVCYTNSLDQLQGKLNRLKTIPATTY